MSKTALLGSRRINAIGLGCMGMSWGYDEMGRDDATSVSVIRRAVALGVDLIDTADAYGPYTNERLVGRALRGLRDQVLLASKAGLVIDGARGVHLNGRPEYLREACEASLMRLGVDELDLYQLHRVDPAVPLAESWGALAELVQEGKVRALGLSEVSVEQIKQAQQIHPVTSVQSELSLTTRDALAEVLPYCTASGISFIAFSPLGRGLLGGRIASHDDLPKVDARHTWQRFQPEAITANQSLVQRVRATAERFDSTVAQVALAWVLAQAGEVLAIPGTKTPHYLEENLKAGALELPADALAELDALPEPVGSRW